jgi:glycosyltransferase involved in cell wall biosynthesis
MNQNLEGKRVLVLLVGEVLEDPRVLKTCRSLAERGAAVTAACTNPSGRPEREVSGDLRIVRVAHPAESLPRRLYRWLSGLRGGPGEPSGNFLERKPSTRLSADLRNAALQYNFRHYLESHKRAAERLAVRMVKESFDLVHANDLDALSAGVALKTAGVTGTLLYDSHEYWAGVGTTTVQNLRLFELEHELIPYADFVVTVNSLIARRLQKEHGLPSLPAVVMNCPEEQPWPERSGPACPVRIVFQGKLQAYRGLETLVRSMAYVPGAVLTVSGFGPLEFRLRALAETTGTAGRVVFAGRYLPAEAPRILAGQDIGVIPYEAVVLNNQLSSPNKLFEYMMAGLAVVSAKLPFLESFVTGNNIGVIVPATTPEGYAAAISSLVSDRTRLAALGKRAGMLAREKYTWKRQFAENYPWTG